MRGYFVKNVGQNRGKPRIWLQGLEVSRSGMEPGARYDIHVKGGTVVFRANPDGTRVVSRKGDDEKALPIIDLNSKELLALFDGMSSIRLVQREGEIYLMPLASELKKKERLSRLKRKLENGEPLAIGSASHGGGVLSHAVHEGLKAGGIKSRLAFANEIRPELLQHASEHNDAWDKDTIPLAAPLQELACDTGAMKHIAKVDVFEAGLPCSGASVAGRAKRGTSMPEEHPEVGHLVVAVLMLLARINPAILLLENVVPYASSASAAILRNQLRDMGYDTHETVLNGEDFNAMEHRKRWFMVAVTQGMQFDWSMIQMPERKDVRLSDILDDIPEDHPSWSEMAGLKAKQERDIAAGKGFLMQVYDGDSVKIGTLTKGIAKNRSTDPKIAHPSNPDLLRVPRPSEHARAKQIPPHLVEGLAATIAHEVLGQSINYEPAKAAAKAIAQSIMAFAEGLDIKPANMAELVSVITNEIEDSASMTVAELRAPLAGVTYEGAITVNDLGAVVQDIGNGVGILHRSDAMAHVRLGEIVKVVYPSIKQGPKVESLSPQAPAQTKELMEEVSRVLAQQQSLFDSDIIEEPARARSGQSPRM